MHPTTLTHEPFSIVNRRRPPTPRRMISSGLASAEELLLAARDHLVGFSHVVSDVSQTSRIAGLDVQGSVTVDELRDVLLLLADTLRVPKAFIIEEDELDAKQILDKERFIYHLSSLLALAVTLLLLLPPSPTRPPPPDVELLSKLLLLFARFTNDAFGEAATTQANTVCTALLSTPARYSVLHQILSKSFPPLFKSHPKINPETGRLRNPPRGGDKAMLDWYEESEDRESWRSEFGTGASVDVVLSGLHRNEIEDVWPLILPPLLAFLDDYDSTNKLTGLTLLSTLLENVDGSLLKRTGIGSVFQQSLDSCYSNLSSPLSPSLLLASHAASHTLINLLHPLPSQARFEAFSHLLSSSIIPVWEYKSSNLPLGGVTARVLPAVLEAMGGGTIRWLQILVPHLSHLLGSMSVGGLELEEKSGEVAKWAAEALVVVVREGAPRMDKWAGVIVDGVGKCWYAVQERGGGLEEWDREVLEGALKDVMKALGQVVPDVRDVVFPRLRALDPLFVKLIE